MPFLTLANGSIIIDTSLLTIEHVGIHQVMILLTDSQGGTREYSLYVTITAGDIEQKVFGNEDWGNGDEGLIDPYIRLGFTSAKIKSVSRYGQMVIEFNETMYTDFN